MFRRIISVFLAVMTLAAVVTAPSLGEDDKRLSTDPAAPIAIAEGAVSVPLGTSASELISCFADRKAVALTDADGKALTTTDLVGSGATVSLGEDTASVVVPGDVDGNAKINSRDVFAAMSVVVGASGRYFEAAVDVDGDSAANGRDVVKLMRYLVGWDETFGAGRAKATDEDDALTVYYTSTMLRIAREDTGIHGEPDGVIRMAKNELEDAHIMLVSTEAKDGLTLDVGDIRNAAGDVLDREVRYGYYYSSSMFTEELYESREKQDWGMVTNGNWSDPYPTLCAPFAIGANESQSFIVKVKTAAGTPAGWYSAPVRVLDGEGRELKRSTLRVYVWDFALDETPASRTLFGMSEGGLGYYYNRYALYDPERDGSWSEIYENNWYAYTLENRISVYGLPSNKAKYLDDPRVTAFVSERGTSNTAADWDSESFVNSVKSDYAFLSQKEEWLDKAYIYTVDEPYGADGIECVKKQWNAAKEALGDIPFKTILPISSNAWVNDYKCDILGGTLDYCNAFCPQSNCFTVTATTKERRADKQKYPLWAEYMDDSAYRTYGQFRPRYEQLRERGDDMWWYICVGPLPPYANWYRGQQGAVNRAVLWQQYLYDIDGILYWDVVFWQVSEKDPKRVNLTRNSGGDGLLLYDGTLWGEGIVPVPSIRLEEVRDGLEDFQYLRQLERVLGRDAALAYTERVTTDILVYSQDWHDIDSARNEMGFALEALAQG